MVQVGQTLVFPKGAKLEDNSFLIMGDIEYVIHDDSDTEVECLVLHHHRSDAVNVDKIFVDRYESRKAYHELFGPISEAWEYVSSNQFKQIICSLIQN